ncbi:MAG TPA: hypothetical protein VHD56_00120, partial [Tepidisphaeraceae bacterium]|nr:hypothetical protein [Tepidisphaeraceae bacterium]
EIRAHVAVQTPDPYIDAAAGAICVAADGIYDSVDKMFMHGAVAWRSRYLGWRGPYSGDALGWHDRTRSHLAYYIRRQNVSPIVERAPGADQAAGLGRSETLLHSNGDMMNSHYDMNLVAIDALFRDLLWTGDLEYAKEVWPVIQRHLAWEQRLFRREFGPDKLPLYEAYAAIWASDDLQYSGGGVAHSSAYNYYHNTMAARVAKLIGQDPAPYEREAALILKAMQTYLWLPDRGWFAETKDLLGKQLTHPAAAVWTNYHTVDSLVPDPMQAWQMARYLDTQIPHIPITGANVPAGYYQLASSSWMPYMWSTNNVVMAETVHSALSEWQTSQNEQALKTFKGALLDSMYLGQCPGNLGMCTFYDDYRRESQRDFGDAIGISSRALVEGLFGIAPDALAHELTIRPGFPRDWDHASITHPDLSYSFKRDGQVDTFIVEPRFPAPMALKLDWQAHATEIASLTVNGQPAQWQNVENAVGWPRISIAAAAAPCWEIKITWRGQTPVERAKNPAVVAAGSAFESSVAPASMVEVLDPQKTLGDADRQPQSLRATAAGMPGHRTGFAKVKQGQLTWLMPIEFEIRPAYEIVQSQVQDDQHLRFKVRNNTPDPITASGAAVNGYGESNEISLAAAGKVPGSNKVHLDLGGGKSVDGVVINWHIKAPGDAAKFETVDLAAAFNDRVTQIFRNDYVSPRSPFCSLAIPRSGVGAWASGPTRTNIDDTGLRQAAVRDHGRFTLPQGVPFATPGEANQPNIMFVSQWDNYPRDRTVALVGKSSHAYLLMAGSTDNMQSRFDNGEVLVTYDDGTVQRLVLENPTNWWPIERDYFVDDYAFARPQPVPPRVDLRTAEVHVNNPTEIKGGRELINGGAATVLDMALNPDKPLKSLTIRANANEVVIGLMGLTLQR